MAVGQVSSVAAQAHTTSSIRVTWESLSSASTYNVYYKLPAAGSWNKLSSIATVYEDVSGLNACTSYTFKVAGSNAAEGSCSSEASARTNCAHTKDWVDEIDVSEAWEAGGDGLGQTHHLSWADSIAVSELFDTNPAKQWVDSVAISEHFSKRKQMTHSKTWTDPVSVTESFSKDRYASPVTDHEVILGFYYSGSWAYYYIMKTGYTGPYGIVGQTGYIEKWTDFGVPGQDKTLCEIQYQGSAPGERTVTVSVSVDMGDSFTTIESRNVQEKYTGFAFPWLTAETFVVRFSGTDLYIHDITMKAVPAGEFDPNTATEV